MTILNLASDGLPPILITLARLVAQNKNISRDDLIKISAPQSGLVSEADNHPRVRATLSRWINLGLFIEDAERIRLSVELTRGESVDQYTDRLPTICRNLALRREHCEPLWSTDGTEKSTGSTADLCRALSWWLAQDIYAVPTAPESIESLATAQVKPGYFIFMNKSNRLPGFRAWAKFLGFAVGDDSSTFCDVTTAVRSELAEVIRIGETIPAAEFVSRLAARLPVLDTGSYRLEIEEALRPETWSAPPDGYMSTALSFALRRLQKQGIINLVTLADAGSRITLTRQGGRTWESFTHVSLLRELP